MVFSQEFQLIIQQAYKEAQKRNHEFLTPEHVLYAALSMPLPSQLLELCGVDNEVLRKSLESYFFEYIPQNLALIPIIQSVRLKTLFRKSLNFVERRQRESINSSDFLLNLLTERDSFANYYLRKSGFKGAYILSNFSETYSGEDFESSEDEEGEEEELESGASYLAQYATDLIEKARQGAFTPLIGREVEIERVIEVLLRKNKNNPICVGEPGVGKTALVHGLAQRIADGNVPEALQQAKMYSIEMGTMLAGTRFRGDFEERLKGLIEEVGKEENAIVFIDELHSIVGAGAAGGGPLDAASLLKPYLTSGRFRCMGTTSYDEYKKYFEKSSSLMRRFEKIDIKEPSREQALSIVKGLAHSYEEFHSVHYTQGALKESVDLSGKYLRQKKWPDKAIDVLDEAGAVAKISKTKNIGPKEIRTLIARMQNLSPSELESSSAQRILSMESDLEKIILGQESAIHAVCSILKHSYVGFRDETKPIASLLFLGSTGVGKTALSQQIAQRLNMNLIRFDMSEYQERFTLSRLIGSPPGYVGYDEGGLLANSVANHPSSVVLLDEIEKAHPDIYSVLLQIMDYGTMTDSLGRTIDFRHAIIIMTSNAGAQEISQRPLGFSQGFDSQDDLSALTKASERIFSPEFRNRLDASVSFARLSRQSIELIAKKELTELRALLTKVHGVGLAWDKEALGVVASEGFSPEFGARNLRRYINAHIKTPLVDPLIAGKISKGMKVTLSASSPKQLNISWDSAK